MASLALLLLPLLLCSCIGKVEYADLTTGISRTMAAEPETTIEGRVTVRVRM